MLAKDLTVGQSIRVSYVNPTAKHPLDRLVVQMDPNGFEVTVTNFREKALVGKGVLVQLSKGALRRVMPDTEVYPA